MPPQGSIPWPRLKQAADWRILGMIVEIRRHRSKGVRVAARLVAVLAAELAVEQAVVPASVRAAAAQGPAAPLAQIRDERQLVELVQSITQDPAIAVDDPAMRPLAQALMTEGVRQLQARAYDQALANFLAAYAKVPNPRILLHVASTLRDMGRLADAANTYQRYLVDPAAGTERVAEVRDLLAQLDEQLTLLTVRVVRGSEVSIDGGPFLRLAGALTTRIAPGLHLVRARTGPETTELTVHGFEGEHKEIAPSAQAASPAGPPAPDQEIDGWLITGTRYSAPGPTARERRVHDSDGREIAAIVPHDEAFDHGEPAVRDPDAPPIASGAIAVLRIDGKGRGFAGGFGLAIARGNLETEIMVLKSEQIGGYLGARYRLFTGRFHPYAALGVPGFAFDHDELQPDGSTMTSKRLAIGVRIAAGVELMISDHLSVQADLGYEHFFFLDDHYEADLFVPTVGVIGRL